MIYLETNAANLNGLLIAIKNFLAANGWTTLVDGTGGGGLALEMTNSNGHDFKFSSSIQAQTDFVTGAFNDRLLKMQLQNGDFGAAAGYDATNWAETNDLVGPFPNVYLFTDDAATFCHCAVQVANKRYSHFSFGDLDNRGLHALDVPYIVGMYHTYWQEIADVSNGASSFNNWGRASHAIGFFGEGSGNTATRLVVGVPDGVADPLLGFADGPLVSSNVWPTSHRYIQNTFGSGANIPASFLDYFMSVDNQGHTGGVPIFPLPMLIYPNDQSALAHIGDIPAIGLVNMTGLSAAQVLDFAGEEWVVFPFKQYGTIAAAVGGVSPLPLPNSLNYGLAYRKTDAP